MHTSVTNPTCRYFIGSFQTVLSFLESVSLSKGNFDGESSNESVSELASDVLVF